MKKFEYKIEKLSFNISLEKLTELGEEGWELVAHQSVRYVELFYFKREKL